MIVDRRLLLRRLLVLQLRVMLAAITGSALVYAVGLTGGRAAALAFVAGVVVTLLSLSAFGGDS